MSETYIREVQSGSSQKFGGWILAVSSLGEQLLGEQFGRADRRATEIWGGRAKPAIAGSIIIRLSNHAKVGPQCHLTASATSILALWTK